MIVESIYITGKKRPHSQQEAPSTPLEEDLQQAGNILGSDPDQSSDDDSEPEPPPPPLQKTGYKIPKLAIF